MREKGRKQQGNENLKKRISFSSWGEKARTKISSKSWLTSQLYFMPQIFYFSLQQKRKGLIYQICLLSQM